MFLKVQLHRGEVDCSLSSLILFLIAMLRRIHLSVFICCNKYYQHSLLSISVLPYGGTSPAHPHWGGDRRSDWWVQLRWDACEMAGGMLMQRAWDLVCVMYLGNLGMFSMNILSTVVFCFSKMCYIDRTSSQFSQMFHHGSIFHHDNATHWSVIT